jgi:dTMP kinase
VLITLEGIEGCGKSTHLRLLSDWLTERGVAHLVTREPGGTGIGEEIRRLLLNPQGEEIEALCELFLYLADRRQHVVRLLEPRLKRGELILCDRFTDATLAYQGWGRGLELEMLRGLNDLATGGLIPDLTLLFDCPPEAGLARARRRAEDLLEGVSREDRFEREELDFHRRVRHGYLELAAADPERFRVIDSSPQVGEVQERVVLAVAPLLGLKKP